MSHRELPRSDSPVWDDLARELEDMLRTPLCSESLVRSFSRRLGWTQSLTRAALVAAEERGAVTYIDGRWVSTRVRQAEMFAAREHWASSPRRARVPV